MSPATRRARRAASWLARQLDRASESGVAQLSAVSLALFGLVTAVGIATFSGRYSDAATFEYAFKLADPLTWALAYTAVSGLVLYAAVRDKQFTVGALLGLAAVHSALGLATIPAFLWSDGLPGGFIQYSGNSVWCFITFLMWRLRIRSRA